MKVRRTKGGGFRLTATKPGDGKRLLKFVELLAQPKPAQPNKERP